MKKVFVVISLLLIFYSNCHSQTRVNNNVNTPAKNIATTLAIDKAFLTGDVSKLDQYIAADAIDYSSTGNVIGIGAIKQFFLKVHAGIGDMQHQILKTYADNEYVFQWMHIWGTNTKQSGLSAGSKYDITIVGVTRFKNGKAIEYREFIQRADIKQHPGDNAW